MFSYSSSNSLSLSGFLSVSLSLYVSLSLSLSLFLSLSLPLSLSLSLSLSLPRLYLISNTPLNTDRYYKGTPLFPFLSGVSYTTFAIKRSQEGVNPPRAVITTGGQVDAIMSTGDALSQVRSACLVLACLRSTHTRTHTHTHTHAHTVHSKTLLHSGAVYSLFIRANLIRNNDIRAPHRYSPTCPSLSRTRAKWKEMWWWRSWLWQTPWP